MDVHEARNVNLVVGSDPQGCGQTVQSGLSTKQTGNLFYYCVIMLNGKAFVASTRLASATNPTVTTTSFGLTTSSSGSSLESSIGGIVGRDAIWDDSFTFDSLPLDVTEMRLCLFCIGAKTSTSASSIVVNNLKKLSSSNGVSKMNSAAAAALANSTFNGKMVHPCLLGLFEFLYFNLKTNITIF